MGEPKCVLQDELKGLGAGFICIYDGKALGVGEQVMFMCSSVSISLIGFLLVPVDAIIGSQRTGFLGKIWDRFF